MIRKITACLVLLSLSAMPIRAQDIQVDTIADDVIVVHEGLVKLTAVRTDVGIVVIDTFFELESAQKARHLILEAFPGLPITYVINTHHHADHVRGNQYFKEAAIIAHVEVERYMQEDYERLKNKYGHYREKLSELKGQLENREDQNDQDSQKLKEDIELWEGARAFLEEYELTLPSIQITSSAVLRFGNKTFDILYDGTAHTTNDMVVLDREDSVLVMGDLLFYRKSYIMNRGSDILNWIEILDGLIARQDEYTTVISGHGGVVQDVEALVEQRDYLKNIYGYVTNARQKGLSLAQAQEELAFDQYKDYIDYDRIGSDVEACWYQLEQKEQNEK
jgi:glyoxylase-like metal-dependent hydrolase (beta-lactamase superfamily II)